MGNKILKKENNLRCKLSLFQPNRTVDEEVPHFKTSFPQQNGGTTYVINCCKPI